MGQFLQKYKNSVSTVIGLIIMTLAVSSFYFDFPQDRNEFVNAIEFAAGIVLVWLPIEKIAVELWEILKKKLEKNG